MKGMLMVIDLLSDTNHFGSILIFSGFWEDFDWKESQFKSWRDELQSNFTEFSPNWGLKMMEQC